LKKLKLLVGRNGKKTFKKVELVDDVVSFEEERRLSSLLVITIESAVNDGGYDDKMCFLLRSIISWRQILK